MGSCFGENFVLFFRERKKTLKNEENECVRGQLICYVERSVHGSNGVQTKEHGKKLCNK